MRTLGMIGGTSWHATIEYYRLINEGVGQVIGTQANPPLIIHSINIEVMRSQNRDLIYATYLDTSRKLEAAGAEAIVVCANTPHMVYDYVQPKISIPILHIARATGKAAAASGLKKLALLGNKPTMTGSFIPDLLKREFKIETMIPQGDELNQSHHYVSKELTQGIFSDAARSFYTRVINQFKSKGADGVILGCTELPILLENTPTSLPALATTRLHAQMAVDFILSNNEN